MNTKLLERSITCREGKKRKRDTKYRDTEIGIILILLLVQANHYWVLLKASLKKQGF